ncbi:MAG: putative quinol monooxygenase, partial [Acidimicrobiia bacterium]
MIIAAGTVTFDGTHQDVVIAAANRVAQITRTETGCISYEFFADLNRPGRMLVFEEWETEDALLNHLQTDHLAEFRAALAAAGLTGRHIKRYPPGLLSGLNRPDHRSLSHAERESLTPLHQPVHSHLTEK